MTTYETPHTRQSFDGLAFVAFVLIALGGLVIFRDVSSRNTEPAKVQDVDTGKGSIAPLQESDEVGSGREVPPNLVDESMFVSPYKEYTLTQGPHGFSYGHMAIDIAAGKDGKIKCLKLVFPTKFRKRKDRTRVAIIYDPKQDH